MSLCRILAKLRPSQACCDSNAPTVNFVWVVMERWQPKFTLLNQSILAKHRFIMDTVDASSFNPSHSTP